MKNRADACIMIYVRRKNADGKGDGAVNTVKIWFTGFWKSFDVRNNMFTQILEKKYRLEITPEAPDFLICSPLGRPYEYERFDCPRIMYTGEFLSADFNAVDYFIGYDDISFADRSFRFPLFLYNDTHGTYESSAPITKDEAREIVKEKKYFCNYIFGHDTAIGKREEILYKLMEYKRVECAGKHLNNMPDGKVYTMWTNRTMRRESKFTISAESVCYPGFTSEKICDAFRNHSVPIYYGDPNVGAVFNGKAFVNCHDYRSIDDAVKKVIELDNDDDQYTEMLCQPRYLDEDYENRMYRELEAYLYHIFDQTREEAYRRPRFYRAGWHETYLKEYNRYMLSVPHRLLKKMKL